MRNRGPKRAAAATRRKGNGGPPKQHQRSLFLVVCLVLLVLVGAWFIYNQPPRLEAKITEHVHEEELSHSTEEDFDSVGPPQVEWQPIGRKACGIKFAPNFLSEEEINHVLALVNRSGGYVLCFAAKAHLCYPKLIAIVTQMGCQSYG